MWLPSLASAWWLSLALTGRKRRHEKPPVWNRGFTERSELLSGPALVVVVAKKVVEHGPDVSAGFGQVFPVVRLPWQVRGIKPHIQLGVHIAQVVYQVVPRLIHHQILPARYDAD
jgi:hypothetical protein